VIIEVSQILGLSFTFFQNRSNITNKLISGNLPRLIGTTVLGPLSAFMCLCSQNSVHLSQYRGIRVHIDCVVLDFEIPL